MRILKLAALAALVSIADAPQTPTPPRLGFVAPNAMVTMFVPGTGLVGAKLHIHAQSGFVHNAVRDWEVAHGQHQPRYSDTQACAGEWHAPAISGWDPADGRPGLHGLRLDSHVYCGPDASGRRCSGLRLSALSAAPFVLPKHGCRYCSRSYASAGLVQSGPGGEM